MDLFNKILLDTNNVLTGYVLLIALLGGGIWFTIQTGFVQFREFGNGWRRVFGGLFKKKKNTSKEGGISSFQALTTAIAAQVGTGNLAGAATAHCSWRSRSDFLDVGIRSSGHGHHFL